MRIRLTLDFEKAQKPVEYRADTDADTDADTERSVGEPPRMQPIGFQPDYEDRR